LGRKRRAKGRPKHLLFRSWDKFRAWLKRNGFTVDARPFTGIYKAGKRIGSYFETSKGIEADLYEELEIKS